MTAESIAAVLGGLKTLRKKVGTFPELAAVTRAGLPAEILPALASVLAMDRRSVARIVGIPERTLSRRLSAHGRLSAEESDRTVRLARVLAMAVETLGTMANASRWLQTPNRALDEHAPFELIDTDAGVQSVETVLGRIAYGVYS